MPYSNLVGHKSDWINLENTLQCQFSTEQGKDVSHRNITTDDLLRMYSWLNGINLRLTSLHSHFIIITSFNSILRMCGCVSYIVQYFSFPPIILVFSSLRDKRSVNHGGPILKVFHVVLLLKQLLFSIIHFKLGFCCFVYNI